MGISHFIGIAAITAIIIQIVFHIFFSIGVSRQTIIAIEADKYSPSLKLAFGIAEAFGVEITRVFSYEAVESKDKNKPSKP